MAALAKPLTTACGEQPGWSADPPWSLLVLDPHDLNRFVTAQAGVYDQALLELRRGRKTSHWMWFVFPQLAGLGRSQTAQFYALASIDEARAYFAHPLLGGRLVACTAAANAHRGLTANQLFGSPDDMKFRSSMTLFIEVAPQEPVFRAALGTFFGGVPDAATLDLLAARG